MFELQAIIEKIHPEQTVLLLGAGASVPSGAPNGKALISALARLVPGSVDLTQYSLAEACAVAERHSGRSELARAVRSRLEGLEPTGGLKLIPEFDWHRIYSTNFDQLVERAYAGSNVPLRVLRSNIDFSTRRTGPAAELYKIHGCITEDAGFGNYSRMLLTEDDYDNFEDFRQASFKALEADVITKDVLIIGQSLDDPHLKDLIRRSLKLRNESATPGRVFVVSHNRDEERAHFHHSRGADVGFGDIDALMAGILEYMPPEQTKSGRLSAPDEEGLLPSSLVGVTTKVGHSLGLRPDARRLFNGAPATYADIGAGLTFRRTEQNKLLATMAEMPIVVLLGAGGVGKTSLARQVLVELGNGLDDAWEHNSAFELRTRSWIEYEISLRAAGKRAALLVDDCVDFLPAIGGLAEHLARAKDPALRLILTANTGKWSQRSKSRYIFSHGEARTLSKLTSQDVSSLLDLVAQKAEIRTLVEDAFLNKSRGDKERILRDRCSSDMYVCMKNIFASEDIDFILLREYADLSVAAQDVYRHVAALEALGARVHRQLAIRLIGVDGGAVAGILNELAGVVTEYDVAPRHGLYGWETRHRQIAATIAKFKFADVSELDRLFVHVIESLNPSIRLEIETARSLCSDEFGIARLSDGARQVELLGEIVKRLPGESIPRHRLIRKLIDEERLGDAEDELRTAFKLLHPNPVLLRYEVLLGIRRAELTAGLLPEDRVALLLDAGERARKIVHRLPEDKHSYRIFGEVGIALARNGGGTEMLEEAIESARAAAPTILDPEFSEIRGRLENGKRTLTANMAL